MYAIIVNSNIKGLCDKPNYVKKKNGIWINCDESDHEAIAIGGVAYEDATTKLLDSGELIFNNNNKLKDTINKVESDDEALIELAGLVAELLAKNSEV